MPNRKTLLDYIDEYYQLMDRIRQLQLEMRKVFKDCSFKILNEDAKYMFGEERHSPQDMFLRIRGFHYPLNRKYIMAGVEGHDGSGRYLGYSELTLDHLSKAIHLSSHAHGWVPEQEEFFSDTGFQQRIVLPAYSKKVSNEPGEALPASGKFPTI